MISAEITVSCSKGRPFSIILKRPMPKPIPPPMTAPIEPPIRNYLAKRTNVSLCFFAFIILPLLV